MKKFLSIILAILMVVTMIPMAVMPASAAENLDYNIKLEVVDWAVYETSGKLIGEFNAVEHGDAFYDVSLTQADDGTFTCSYQIALERNDGNTAWNESSISFKIDSCEDEFMQEFEKSFYSSYNIFYNLKVTRSAGDSHTFKDATCVAPKTCAICGVTKGDIDATAHSWANLDGICANGCGATCAHENQTGLACEICGADIHVCSNYNNGFCTECDAYEPATLVTNENYESFYLKADYVGYYAISNAGQLFWYANYINTVDRTANAVLVADIDLENRPWTPIGSTGENSNNFRGIFDGQNYYIRGLYVEGDRAGLGFFGEVRTGTVKNFTIFGEVVVNTEVDYVGGVIGSICGVNGENDLERNGAIIQNIRSFVNLTAKAHGIGKIGGFVGYANHQSLIENCSWYGTFDAGKYRVDNGAGGFIGRIQENTSEVTIRNCAAFGTIKTNYAGDYNNTATIYMGGFLSFTNTNAKTTLENCLFAGKFERGENLTDQAFLGAFGTLRSVNAIKNCYYLGDDGLEAVHSDSNLKPGSDNVEITKVTEEQLKSGEIAYKLQGEQTEHVWGQNIGTDSFPVIGGEKVYYGCISCVDEVMVYTNDIRASDNDSNHAWGEGVLTRPTKTQDGYYTYTCSACGETKTEPVLRAANYEDYEKALEDLRAYLDSDMLTDENKGYISQWLATYDTDEVFCFIAGEEATVQEYIDATAYYASEIEAAIEDCLAGNHSGNGETCEICGTTIKFATVTDSTNTYYAADAATLNQAVTAILETGSRTFTVELPADTEAEMITAIRRAICDTEGVADGSIHLTLKGVTSIPGTTNWDGVAFGPGDIYDEAGEIVDQELVTQLASINLPDVTEIGAQAFYFCENLVSVSAPKAQTIGAQALGYTALTSVEFPELTTIPTDMFSGTWTLSSAKFPKVTTIEQNGLLIGFGFAPENNPTPFPLELTAEGDITFNGSNHFNIASQNYSGKVDLVLNIDKKEQVTFNDDGTATWQVRDDLSYTFKSITFTCTDGTTNHSYTYTDNGDGTHDMVCTGCGYLVVDNEAHSGGTATCTEQAKCEHCGASYGEVDKNNHDETVAYVNGFCPNCDAFEPAKLVNGVYEISNAGNLYWFADKVTNENAAYGSADAILTCDIRVNEGTMTEASTGARVWTPIGKHGFGVNIPYTGTFEGNGKTVSGLYFNDTSANFSVGLFSLVGEGGKVQNVGIADSYLCGSQNIGAVAGSNYGTVTGCYNTGIISGSGNSVGGVVGYNYGTATNCYNTGTVSGTSSVGGVVGSNHGTVTGCYNTGTISGSNDVGGVAGNGGSMSNCYNTGTVSGTNSVGGVVGDNQDTVTGCYNTGTVSGTTSVGGVAGYNWTTVTNCYSSGTVSGTTDVGGVVGFTNATVTNCYFDSTVYTGDAIGNNYGTATDVEGKSTEQFAGGEVAYLLSQGENGSIWGQTIGTDPAPVFSDAKVYYGYTSCGDTVAKYTNDETISAEKPDHTQKPTYTDNGNGTHSAVYPCCGTTVTEEHTLTYTAKDNVITAACSANCGYSGTATISATGKIYDETAVEVVVSKTGSLENTIIPVTLTKDGEAFTGEPVNAGTYTASIGMGENENAVVASVEFIIEKANPVIAAAPTPNTLTYIGEAQYLISAGEAVGGAMVYSLTENGEYTTTIPQGTNAGDYTVWYYVQGDANHNDSAKDSVPVTIKKAPLTVTASDATITYGEAPTNNGVTYSGFVNGENEGVLGGELAYTYTYTQNGNVGDYSITPEGLTADNYEITFVDGTLTVEQIDINDIIDEMKINLEQYSYVYDGTEKKPKVTSITVDGVTLTEGTDYTVRYEDNVNVDEEATAVIIFEGNYDGIFRKWFTITKAYYDLTAPTPNTLTYNGEDQYLVSAGTVEGADFEYSLDGASWSTSIPQAKDVGNYTVYYRVLADENHYDVEGTVDVTIKECAHEWGEGVLTRPTFETAGYYTYTCTLCGHSYTEPTKKADDTALNDASMKVMDYISNNTLTQEAANEIHNSYLDILKNNGNIFDEFGFVRNDLVEEDQPAINAVTAELEKIVADAEEKIASGEYVKADYTEVDEAIASVDEALENATISEEMANELSDIKSQLEALKENENTSMADAAELLERVKAVAETMADCANGIHSFTKYEEVTAPECGKTGLEKADCDHGCGATDEREIPALTHEPLEAVKENEVAPKCGVAGSYDLVVYCDLCGDELDRDTVTVDALTHTDEDGDYLCDHGCGHEFEKPAEPDTPDEPADGDCDHLCHKSGIMSIFWKIIRFFYRLFNIQQYCDCGVIHYDAPVFG